MLKSWQIKFARVQYKNASLDAKDEAVGEDTVEDLCSVLLPLLLLLLPPLFNSASQPRQPPPTADAAEV